MGASKRFAAGLGHLDRHAGLKGYCIGPMLPLARKSVEPMAARVDPMRASARHQALASSRARKKSSVAIGGDSRTPRNQHPLQCLSGALSIQFHPKVVSGQRIETYVGRPFTVGRPNRR